MAEFNAISYACAETDSYNKTQITNDSFDIGAFSKQVNESYAYFSLAGLPENAKIISFDLWLMQKTGSYYNKSVSVKASVCENYIKPSSVCWNNKPKAGKISGKTTISSNSAGERKWTLLNAETDEPYPIAAYLTDNILVVKFEIEGAAAGDNNAKGFRASNYATVSARPRLKIAYELPQGVKVYKNGVFTEKPVRVYTGGTWKEAVVRKYKGGSWKA